MENENRLGKVLLILAGLAIALCVGMTIGGVLVYGVMRIGDLRSSRAELELPHYPFKELYEEQIEEFVVPEFAPGAVIVEVLPGTPADQAGLQEGDVIVAVDSWGVGPDGNLAGLISQYEPGDRLTLQVRRGDKGPRAVRVKLGENPDLPGAPYLGVRYQSALPQGMPSGEMLPLDEMMPFDEMMPLDEHGEWQLDELPMPLPGNLGGAGVTVISVTERSPAGDAGLQQGDLITSLDGEPFASAEALSDAIARRQPGDRVALGVIRTGDEGEVELQVRLGEHPDQPGKAYLGVTIGDAVRHLRGMMDEGERMPLDELPFNWDDLRRRFEPCPHLDDDGNL
jgi:membrane-associated protease RseP (regulator of RpoE activity)